MDFEILSQVKSSLSQIALRRRDSVPVFIKRLKTDVDGKKRLDEVSAELKKVDHWNCLRFFSSFTDKDNFYCLAMELSVAGESLDKLIIKQDMAAEPFSEKLIATWGLQIARAFAHLHGLKIIHKALEPKALIVQNKKHIVVGNFELSIVENEKNCKKSQLDSTPIFMAPEILKEQPFDSKVDVWSFGVLLYQIATFDMPVIANNNENKNQSISIYFFFSSIPIVQFKILLFKFQRSLFSNLIKFQ